MIMLAKVVSYGGNSVRYALEKENAKTVKVNNMPDGLDPTAIWYMMKHHCQYHQAERTVGRKLERFMTTFVLSPSKEESANFTMEDWANLQDEALRVLDSVGLMPNGFSNVIKTNFTNSMNVADCTLILSLERCTFTLIVVVWIWRVRPMMYTTFTFGQ